MNKAPGLEAQRMAVFTAALEFAKDKTDLQMQKRLLLAADEYSKARWSEHNKHAQAHNPAKSATGSKQAAGGDNSLRILFGRAAGKKLPEVLVSDLVWYRDWILKSFDDPDPERLKWRDKNEKMLKAIYAECLRRGVKLP